MCMPRLVALLLACGAAHAAGPNLGQPLTHADLAAWKLPRVAGYVFNGRITGNDFQSCMFGLPADTDFPKFTPVTGRKWFDGHILFENVEFESDVEPKVRDAFEEEFRIAANRCACSPHASEIVFGMASYFYLNAIDAARHPARHLGLKLFDRVRGEAAASVHRNAGPRGAQIVIPPTITDIPAPR